jgi:hypothetical protein
MRPLREYLDELKEIARQTSEKVKTNEDKIYWGMMLVGVIVTGTMTYSLCHKGMADNALWENWVDFAAFLPVVLMEGSAIWLTYGKHNWFRSEAQQKLAEFAGWCIWIVLALTSIVHFALGKTTDRGVQYVMSAYASYVLPLAIVVMPMLWKRLYDLKPESQARVAVLEAEAELKKEIIDIEREKNRLMIESYRDSLNTDRVQAARDRLFEQASIEHAREIAGFIEGTVEGEIVEESENGSGESETESAPEIEVGGEMLNEGNRRPARLPERSVNGRGN